MRIVIEIPETAYEAFKEWHKNKVATVEQSLIAQGIPYEERPHGTCKTCKYYVPFREQFSYRHRGDGYCKSPITNAEGNAYINCHDEWYCANYKKAGDEE